MASNTITTRKNSSVDFSYTGASMMLVSAFALLVPLAAYADDTDVETLDEVSVTASRVSTAIKESPVTIDIIGEEELDTVKFVDSETELLNRIPGTSMTRNLRMPMGSKNYTVNLIDGMSVNTFGSGVQGFANDTNSLDIQRVEVLRGPSSVLYGSNAVGGVINVITKDTPLEPEYRVWAEAGLYGRKRGGGSAAGTAEGLGYFLDANFLESDGWQRQTKNQRKTFGGKLSKDLSDNSMLTVRLELLDVIKENPGTLSSANYSEDWSLSASTDAFTDERMATLSAAYMLAPSDNSELNVNYSVRHHTENGQPSYSASADYGEDEVVNQNLTATYRHDFDFYRSRIIGGADLQYSDANEVGFDGRHAGAALSNDWDITALVTSPFLQYEVSPLERLRLTMGVRYDRVKYEAKERLGETDDSTTFSSLTRKIGATWSLDPTNSLWVGYGEGFVVPSRSNLFTTTRNTPNPNLDPERAENMEAGIRGRLLNKRLQYDLALYHTTIKDFVVTGDDGDTIVNAGEARFKGIEASAGFLATDYLRLAGAYTYARNIYINYRDDGDVYDGNDLSSSPKHHVNLRATVTPIDNLDIELEWDKISSYYTNADNDADPDGKASRPGIFNLRASYDQGAISYWAHARNLFDKKHAKRVSYSPASGWTAADRKFTSGEPRTVYAGVSYNW